MQQRNAEEAQDSPGNTLYLRFASMIFTYLSQQVANLQDAEDLLMEVFIVTAIVSHPCFTMSRAKFRFASSTISSAIASDEVAAGEGALRTCNVSPR